MAKRGFDDRLFYNVNGLGIYFIGRQASFSVKNPIWTIVSNGVFVFSAFQINILYMNLIDQVNPTKEQFTILAKNYPRNEPVTMINLIKFRDKAWDGERTGAEAYECYSNNVFKFVKKVKGRLIWKGQCMHTIIGDPQDQPHLAMLVEYPSIDNFLEMIADPAYQKCANDRTMALEYGGLIASKTVYPE